MKLVIISPSGDSKELSMMAKPSLRVLQESVGGYIELVKVRWQGKIRDAYVDEDGISKQLAPNLRASDLTVNNHRIFGPMVIYVPLKELPSP